MLTATRTSTALLFPLGSLIDKKKKKQEGQNFVGEDSLLPLAEITEITVNVWLRNHQSMLFVSHKKSW